MRTASTALLTALTLVVFAHGGVLACGASDPGGGVGPVAGSAGAAIAAGAGGAPAAGAGGAPAAGAPAGGALGVAGSGGASAGSGGAGGSVAGAGGASGGAAGNAGNAGNGGMAGMGGAAPFALTSPSFMNKPGCAPNNQGPCDKFAKEFLLTTIGGSNQSPELDWTAGPSGTLSYAIVLYDQSNTYTHWAVWNIPMATRKLPASLPGGSDPGGLTGVKQVSFFMNKDAYAGPGANSHVYQFKLYALKVASISPTLPNTDPQKSVRTLLEGSADVLAKVDLVAATPQ